MTARRTLPLGLAGCALVAVAAPAWAHPEPPAEPGAYEYAQPAPVEPPVIYREQEVVQPLPGDDIPPPPHGHAHSADHDHADAPLQPEHGPDRGHDDHVPMQPPHMAHAYPPIPPHAYPPQPEFAREEWLDECRARLGDRRGRDEGGVGGGILGAIVGGVIGNRVASGERLAGTLIGAGVGGLAGVAIGSAIGATSRDRRDDRAAEECELYLEDYYAGYGRQAGYGYGYPAQMTYVPVLVMVPQRAVVRETVIEEWVDAPAPARRTIHRPSAPAPATKAVKVRRVKGK